MPKPVTDLTEDEGNALLLEFGRAAEQLDAMGATSHELRDLKYFGENLIRIRSGLPRTDVMVGDLMDLPPGEEGRKVEYALLIERLLQQDRVVLFTRRDRSQGEALVKALAAIATADKPVMLEELITSAADRGLLG